MKASRIVRWSSRFPWPAFVLALCTLLAAAGAQDTVRARGEGATEDEAVRKALIDAVRQTVGVIVEGGDAANRSRVKEVLGTVETTLKTWRVDDTKVSVATQGFVRSYQVVERGAEDDGRRWVVLEAVVVVPGAGRKDGTVALQVFAVDIAPEAGETAATFGAELTRQLRLWMTTCGAFRVLETERTAELAAILERVGSDRAFSPDERAKLGQRLSADYVLLTTLRRCQETVVRRPPVELSGVVIKEFPEQLVYQYAVDYRVVDVARMQVVQAGELRLGNQDGTDPLAGRPESESVRTAAARVFCGDVADAVLDRVRPLLVAEVDGAEIFLASGAAGRVDSGAVFDVFRPGKVVRHPETGEELGRREQRVGAIRVTVVHEKYSVAEAIEGLDPAKVEKGFVVRRRATSRR